MRLRCAIARAGILVVVVAQGGPAAADPIIVYSDWTPWGVFHDDFAAGRSTAVYRTDAASPEPVHGCGHSISLEPDGGTSLWIERSAPIDPGGFDGLEFWIHGGTAGGQALHVVFLLDAVELVRADVADYLPGGILTADAWHEVRVPFDAIGLAQPFDGLRFEDPTGTDQATLWLDSIVISDRPGPAGPIAVVVNPDLDRRPVNPWIFGVNYLQYRDQPPDPLYPLQRWGGNIASRYSWISDVVNHGADYLFLSTANNPVPSWCPAAGLPDNSRADCFIDQVRASGGDVLLGVPTIGWTPTDRQTRWGFSVAKYGTQQETECTINPFPGCNTDAGNGIDLAGMRIQSNPADTSTPTDPTHVTGWMDHVAGRVGTSGVRLFELDNEPSLWRFTHQDVHFDPLGADEAWQRTVAYASAIKASNPEALVFGPAEWGWCGYFWTDLDGCGNDSGPDHRVNGDFLPWYLRQVRDNPIAPGVRLVDYLDIHWYPQQPCANNDEESPLHSALRLRNLKGLYDPSYHEEGSYVRAFVELIPRMRRMIDGNAPGMKLAITEYLFGGDHSLSSALAQVEALAIFAREGVDLAARFPPPEPGTLAEDAFRLYLDYDRSGSRVMGDSVSALSSRVDDVGAYAIRGTGGEVYLVLVNKATASRTVDVDLTWTLAPEVKLYGFDATTRLRELPAVTAAGSRFTVLLPARSARLALGRCGGARPGTASGLLLARDAPGTGIVARWSDATGASEHVLREDSDPSGAFSVITVRAGSGSTGTTVPLPAATTYYLVAGSNSCGEGPLR